MKTFDLFGSTLSLEHAVREATRTLGVAFLEHDSEYKGGAYFRGSDVYVLQRNAELGDELQETDFPDVPTLLYVSNPEHPDQTKQILEASGAFRHLRRELS